MRVLTWPDAAPLAYAFRGAAVLLLVGVVAFALACSGAGGDSVAGDQPAQPGQPVPEIKTPTPVPTPTRTPVPVDGSVFPPPPPRPDAPPPNEYGIERIAAPVLHLDHYVELTPVTDAQMQAPEDASYAVGYYPDFKVRPGESGNAVFSAHETWEHMQAPFFTLHLAERGDDLYITMKDGRLLHYQITSKKRYEADAMPMGEILNPPQRPFGKSWVTLITCGGRIVYDHTGFGEYLDRDVVVAELVKEHRVILP